MSSQLSAKKSVDGVCASDGPATKISNKNATDNATGPDTKSTFTFLFKKNVSFAPHTFALPRSGVA